MNWIAAIILAIIEGLTELLPVSSTGHMIIASSMMNIAQDEFVKLFTVCIQLGAILSVFVLYWRRFFQSFDFYLKLFIAFLPAAIFGILLNDLIDAALGNVIMVAVNLVIGGIVLLYVDKWFVNNEKIQGSSEISYLQALKIGSFQVVSMLPGVSRSAATIIGGLTTGLNRSRAAEFSFLLAMPTMTGATAKQLYDYFKVHPEGLSQEQWMLFALGNVVAFIVALLAIKQFVAYLTRRGFKVFGWYRIIIGAIILGLYALGVDIAII